MCAGVVADSTTKGWEKFKVQFLTDAPECNAVNTYIHSILRFMTTLLRTKRRFYIRPKSAWAQELRDLYGNFISFHFSLNVPGSHLIYLPGPRDLGLVVD